MLPLTMSPTSASPQQITVSGTVTCVPLNVKGVWVEVGNGGSGSGSGWANMSAEFNTAASTTYEGTFKVQLPAKSACTSAAVTHPTIDGPTTGRQFPSCIRRSCWITIRRERPLQRRLDILLGCRRTTISDNMR